MKSRIMLTSAAAVLVSVAGANAMDYRPFVGVNMGMQGIVYTDSMKSMEHGVGAIDLPNDFFVFGAETGVRFCDSNCIYNGGLTLSATKTTYSRAQDKYTGDLAANTDMFNISVTYDNYIRISGDKTNRIDLVLGVGAGAMAYHAAIVNADDETIWSFTPELKVGMDFEMTQNITLSAHARAFVPTRDHYAADMSYIFGGSIKYLF